MYVACPDQALPTVCVSLGRVVTMPFHEAMRAGLVDVPLILSSMQHEVNGWSGHLVFHLTKIEWASYLHAYFSSWPRGTVRYAFDNTTRFKFAGHLAKVKR